MPLIEYLRNQANQGPGPVRTALRVGREAWRWSTRLAYGTRVLPRALARLAAPRRVLGILHLQEQDANLGDVMEVFAILNTLRVWHGLAAVDLAFIDDPSNPNRPGSRERLEASPELKQMLFQLLELLPCRGAVLHFDSDAAFEVFFRRHYFRYVPWPAYGFLHTWPSRVEYRRFSDRGFAYPNYYAPLYRHFDRHGSLPRISSPTRALDWAHQFLRSRIFPATAVVAQIRFNPDTPARNTDLDAWMDFFQRMEVHHDIKFVLISRREEVVPELRRLPNVVYSKDHGSGILEDLALVQTARLSLFPDAGFATFPWFCGTPTIFFGKQKHPFAQARMMDEDAVGPRFLNRFQRVRLGPYTADTLEREFWSLWNDLRDTTEGPDHGRNSLSAAARLSGLPISRW